MNGENSKIKNVFLMFQTVGFCCLTPANLRCPLYIRHTKYISRLCNFILKVTDKYTNLRLIYQCV